jgi:hypothetical protein
MIRKEILEQGLGSAALMGEKDRTRKRLNARPLLFYNCCGLRMEVGESQRISARERPENAAGLDESQICNKIGPIRFAISLVCGVCGGCPFLFFHFSKRSCVLRAHFQD